jgi:quinol monooxygenase YgiN
MSVVQSYALTAAAGKEAALEEALHRLAAIVGSLEGCEGVTLLRDSAADGRYIFMETYTDTAAHQASAAHLPKAIFSELMAVLAEKPEVRSFFQIVTSASSRNSNG